MVFGWNENICVQLTVDSGIRKLKFFFHLREKNSRNKKVLQFPLFTVCKLFYKQSRSFDLVRDVIILSSTFVPQPNILPKQFLVIDFLKNALELDMEGWKVHDIFSQHLQYYNMKDLPNLFSFLSFWIIHFATNGLLNLSMSLFNKIKKVATVPRWGNGLFLERVRPKGQFIKQSDLGEL